MIKTALLLICFFTIAISFGQSALDRDTVSIFEDSINFRSFEGRYDKIDYFEISESLPPSRKPIVINDSLLMLFNVTSFNIITGAKVFLTPKVNQLGKLKHVYFIGDFDTVNDFSLAGSSNALQDIYIESRGSKILFPSDMSIFKNLSWVSIHAPKAKKIDEKSVITFFKQLSQLKKIEGCSFYLPSISEAKCRHINAELKTLHIDFKISQRKNGEKKSKKPR